jgi:putative transposase
MQYRRDYTQGASYFFTVVTFRRVGFFNADEAVSRLRGAFKEEMVRRPFVIDAIVILPDHIHSVWTLPQEDADYSMRWRNIKRSHPNKWR